MRTLSIVALIFLVGCAGRPTLEELEAEASVSGDWKAVEQRERMIERMSVQTEAECAEGLVYYCQTKGHREICSCESARNPGFFH